MLTSPEAGKKSLLATIMPILAVKNIFGTLLSQLIREVNMLISGREVLEDSLRVYC